MKRNESKSHSLGNLERDIMDIAWKIESATVRDILEKIQVKRKVAYTTVMTVMNRLCEKKILKRSSNSSGAFVYRPAQDKTTFFSRVSKKLADYLIKEFGEIAVTQFVDAVENSDSDELKNWRRKIKKIR